MTHSPCTLVRRRFGVYLYNDEQAEAFAERLHELVEDFEHLSTPGEDSYGFFGAIYQQNVQE